MFEYGLTTTTKRRGSKASGLGPSSARGSTKLPQQPIKMPDKYVLSMATDTDTGFIFIAMSNGDVLKFSSRKQEIKEEPVVPSICESFRNCHVEIFTMLISQKDKSFESAKGT